MAGLFICAEALGRPVAAVEPVSGLDRIGHSTLPAWFVPGAGALRRVKGFTKRFEITSLTTCYP